MDKPNRIELISLPESLKDKFPIIEDAMMKTLEKRKYDWDFDSGYLPQPELSSTLDVYWVTFSVIGDINEVIENMNLVLTELELVSKYPGMWELLVKERLSKKYVLAVRTYFYELFRAKEIFGKYLDYLAKNKLISKKAEANYKDEFRMLFKPFIKIRNRMVHESFSVPGEHYRLLIMTELASEGRMKYVQVDTGEVITAMDKMEVLCDEFQKDAYLIGAALVKYVGSFCKAASDNVGQDAS